MRKDPKLTKKVLSEAETKTPEILKPVASELPDKMLKIYEDATFTVKCALRQMMMGKNIRNACDDAGVSRGHFWRWRKASKENEGLVEFIRDASVCVVEDKLMSLCEDGNIAAVIFYLKNRAPHNWNIEGRQQVRLSGEVEIRKRLLDD